MFEFELFINVRTQFFEAYNTLLTELGKNFIGLSGIPRSFEFKTQVS